MNSAVALRALAPAKVNLGLLLGPARGDGRHELVTVYQSVSLADELTVTTADADEVVCPGVAGENLVSAALGELRQRGWDGPPLRVEIVKRIPVAAGLAGGSADAAAALRLALALHPGRPEEVAEVAARLGSDVPAQLAPGLSLGTGAGDCVEPLAPLAAHAFVILPRAAQLSTADVFAEADRLGLPRTPASLAAAGARLRAQLRPGVQLPAETTINDLQPASMSLMPTLGEALEDARSAGADDVFVCGSGPTVAGLFWSDRAQARARAAARALQDRYPHAVAASPVTAEFGAPSRLPSSP